MAEVARVLFPELHYQEIDAMLLEVMKILNNFLVK